MTTVAIEQAQQNLLKLIDDVAHGEQVVITKDNIPVAELVPVTPVSAAPQFGSAKGLLKMSDDFDAPLDDFRAYEA